MSKEEQRIYRPAVQYMTVEDAETIGACVSLAYKLLYGKEKCIESKDERVSKERIFEVIGKLTADRVLDE